MFKKTFIKTNQKRCDKGKKCGCQDVYFYTFEATQLAEEDDFYAGRSGYIFDSREHWIDREAQDCDKSTRMDPLFDAGDVTECWRPAVPDEDLPKQYRCGNSDCIKVLDPQLDVDRAQGIAKAFWISGSAVLGVSIPVGIIGAVLCIKKTRIK